MASLWKRKNSKYYVACFATADGRQLKRSTGTSDRRKALGIAEKYEIAARTKRTATQTRRVLADLHFLTTGETLTAMTVEKFLGAWLARKKPEVSTATYAHYNQQVTAFVKWLGERRTADIGTITRADIVEYRNALAGRVTGKTTNHSLRAIKSMFKDARRDGHIAENPAEFVEPVRQRDEAEHRRPFTVAEVQAILGVADREWRSMILFGLYTGQRLSDIAALCWRNVDLETGEIRLTVKKTGRRQILPIALPLREHIEAMDSSDDLNAPLHPRAQGHIARTGRTARLSNQFAELLVQAGLRNSPSRKTKPAEDEARTSDETSGRKQRRRLHDVSFHALRHSVTSWLKSAGIPASVAQAFVGHDDEAMSKIYTHTGMDALKKAAEAIPKVL